MNTPTAEAVEAAFTKFNEMDEAQQDALMAQAYRIGSEHKANPDDVLAGLLSKEDEEEEQEQAPETTATDKTDGEATDGGDGTSEPESADTADGSEASDSATDEPVDVSELNRLKNVERAFGKQANELGGLRQQVQQFQPFITAMANPAFRDHIEKFYGGSQAQPQQSAATQVPEDFDPYNPEHIRRLVDSRAAELNNRMRAEQQRVQQAQSLQRWNAQEQANRAKLVASGVAEDEINNAIAEMQKAFVSGDVAGMALKLSKQQRMIEEAEKRGYDKAMKKIQEKASASPKRTAGASAKKGGGSIGGKPAGELSNEELAEAINTGDVDSPQTEAYVKELTKRQQRQRQ